MRTIPVLAQQQCGVFSTWQAERSGWTRSALRHAVRSGRLNRLRVGAYQVADLTHLDRFERARWHHAGKAIAGVLVTPGSSASHSTAAVLHGMPLLYLPSLACAVVEPWLTGSIPDLHIHRCTTTPRLVPTGGITCTTVERTAIDLAREHGVLSGVLALDFALHNRLTDTDRLGDELARCTRWPGLAKAREALDLSDGLAESPLETRSRLRIWRAELPKPRIQVPIGNGWGGFVARVDFYWDEFGVVGEADGALKYDGSKPLALAEEKARQEKLADLGLQVVRWGNTDLGNFTAVAQRLRRAFARGVRRDSDDRLWRVLS